MVLIKLLLAVRSLGEVRRNIIETEQYLLCLSKQPVHLI